MKVEVLADEAAVARSAAALLAAKARTAVSARGQFVMVVSGGRTPWQMVRSLASEEVPWKSVHVVQVDERVAPDGDPDRNLTHLIESLLEHASLPPQQLHAMPVVCPNLEAAASQYAQMQSARCPDGGDVCAKVGVERTVVALPQNFKVPSCLGCLDHTKHIFRPGTGTSTASSHKSSSFSRMPT